jgi:hypothetical protein
MCWETTSKHRNEKPQLSQGIIGTGIYFSIKGNPIYLATMSHVYQRRSMWFTFYSITWTFAEQ